ncbi:MAG: sigma 54-interacting transcriptional regulator [Bacillota bacterium]|nr:sigma 54-interacting transcriptional regulator [Bacillota bacterium]
MSTATENNQYEDWLSTIIESVYNGIIAIDINGCLTIFNSTAERLTGVPKAQALGRHIQEIIPDTKLLEILKSGKPSFSQKIILKHATAISNRTPIIKNNQVVGAIAVFQDISELESISQELATIKKLNKELDTIIEAVYDGLYIADGNGYTTRINKSYERITGVKQEEVIGKHLQELVDQGLYSESVTLQILKEKKLSPVTIMHLVKGEKPLLITGTPVVNEQNDIISVVTTVRDISELNHLQEELEKSKNLTKLYQIELEQLKIQQGSNSGIVYQSNSMEQVLTLAKKVAQVDATVLLLGETGVGKELVAKEIHNRSPRCQGPFITVNCGAIPETLLESELFGYEKGAFTGAGQSGKPGMFELANHGTILLDEIGDLPLTLQVKLLRVLQEKTVSRIGSTQSINLNIRIIAATHNDLLQKVTEGTFREDLYYRLNVLPIYIPPLRERTDDITILASSFLQTFNSLYTKNVSLTYDAYSSLLQYDWPGNVRELRNTLERIVVVSSSNIVTSIDITALMTKKGDPNIAGINQTENLTEALKSLEKLLIQQALAKYGSTYKASKALGVSQPTIVRKAKRYNI